MNKSRGGSGYQSSAEASMSRPPGRECGEEEGRGREEGNGREGGGVNWLEAGAGLTIRQHAGGAVHIN